MNLKLIFQKTESIQKNFSLKEKGKKIDLLRIKHNSSFYRQIDNNQYF